MSAAEFLLIVGGVCFVVFGLIGLSANKSLHKENNELIETIVRLRNPVVYRDEKGRFCKKQAVYPETVSNVEQF